MKTFFVSIAAKIKNLFKSEVKADFYYYQEAVLFEQAADNNKLRYLIAYDKAA